MVVKIPIKRGKRTSEQAILESPGTKTTMVTNEKDAPCKLRAVAAKKKRRKTNSNEGDVGDNSSISSRSSMNSDRDVRDRVEGGKSTTYGSSTNAATAASTRALPSEDYTLTICSPSDQTREQIDHSYYSPDTLLIGAASPTPSTTSLDWQFSGSMENFFEENDRAAGLSPINNDTEKINAEGCSLEQCQLESFDSVDRKLLLRESSNGDGSGTSNSTLKITNESTGRMPLPSPSACYASLPVSNKSHVATTPLALPTTSISDIFTPDSKRIKPLYLARKSGGGDCNIFESSPSVFLNIQPANSFSDLLSTPAHSNEEHAENIQPTAAQAVAASVAAAQKESQDGESGGSDKTSDRKDIMQALKDTVESELHLPTALGHNLGGHRRFVINGPLKTCTDSSIDRINTDGKDAAFYQFLQMLSPAFEGCIFLLPWLRASETKSKVTVSLYGSFKLNQGTLFRPMSTGPSEIDLTTAKRRIQSTICAFGGTINSKKEEEHPPVEKLVSFSGHNSKSSIFRSRSSDATSKPSKSSSTSSKSAGLKRKKKNKSILRRERYEKKLRDQYFENGNRLSWDVQHSLRLTLSGAKTFDEEDNSDSSVTKPSTKTDSDFESNRPTQYKCTLCGALKKKHVCTNQPTILRSIGVNVYPAVNAYTADEPGSLTCALTEMNNFITSSSNGVCGLTSEEVLRENTKLPAHIQLTPCTIMKPHLRKSILSGPPKRHQQSHREEEESHNHSINLIFQPSMEITNDQYLNVTTLPSDRDYTYPAVPLTFGQRKSMSDALLSISKSVPELTQACALILKDARKKNQWDQAVAELMAQVLCILKCSSSKDYSLEGLKRYLLEFGISC
ncbi:hypothetical protein QTG54_006293 [Skeletonema marinoi]|uniref:Uncharacterized protein n=1 Tax=Skeletonema marinoi TaxID=267567 RepID=A0AAD8YCC2_9STRA|nr:hypothetical protein QTG54_006293 [Skeletonema marinoi]